MKLPVPPGFVVTTESCIEYYRQDKQMSSELVEEYTRAVHELEHQTGRKFPCDPMTTHGGGGKVVHGVAKPDMPLLLSVRSGAHVSMPGMMDTVLNLGMNDSVAQRLAAVTNNPRFALDTYRRFLQMYGSVVMGVDKDRYQEVLVAARAKAGVDFDNQLTASDWQQVVTDFKVGTRRCYYFEV
jgi:pyruvate,orthophosphate dikinase